jgi:hypothetical protein
MPVRALPLLLALALSAPALGSTPGGICQAAKLRAAAGDAYRALRCHATATSAGVPVEAACLTRADAVVATGFVPAESRGGCLTAGDAGAVAGTVTAMVGAYVAALRPAPDASRCAGGKLRAVAKEFLKLSRAYAKFALGDDAGRLAREEQQAHGQVVQAFVKAEAAGDCLTLSDAGTADAQVTADVVTLRAVLLL